MSSVGLGTLAVTMVARGDVSYAVRRRRFWEALAAAVIAVMVLLVMFVLWLWYEPPLPPPPSLMAEPEVELVGEVIGKPVRIRRPAVVQRQVQGPAPAFIALPEQHQVLSWRLDCPPSDETRGQVAKDQRVIRIPVVPPRTCAVVLTSPSGSMSVPITAGSAIRCRSTSTLVCR